MAGAFSLIGTKLHPPCVRENLVPRPRLSALLDEGLRPGRRLILISAPAGYGKTTLAAAWLAGLHAGHAWLSLEESENEPVRFLAYLGAALAKAAPEFNTYTGSLAGMPQLPAAGTAAVELVNAMVPSPRPYFLVLDDYHTLNGPYIHDFMRVLLQYQPPSFRPVIVTREDPSLPLNRMRARGEMIELRMEDLCFTVEEAREFLQAMGLALRDEAVASCAARTEGWAAGLQLAALSLQGRTPQEAEAFVAAFGGTHRYIIDYLVDEVLSRQDPGMRGFLRRTAVLDRFSPALCDVVTGRGDSREMLRKIEANNLFLVPLDGEREWFRYHHLFAGSLRAEIGKAERAKVHSLAARWFEERGDLSEAVKQVFAAGEITAAVHLIISAAPEMLLRGEPATLRDWLESLPEEVVFASDDLISVKPWALCLTGRLSGAEAFLAKIIPARRAGLPARSQGLLRSLEAMLASHREDHARAADLAREALQLIDGKIDPVSRASTLDILGWSLEYLGNIDGAELAFREAYAFAEASPRTYISSETVVYLGHLLDLRGRRREAESICRRHYRAILDEADRLPPFGGLLAMQLGVLSYEANELAAARDLLETGVELCRAFSLHWDAQGEERLALTLDALGEHDAALEVLRGVYRPEASADALFTSTSVEAEIRRRHGDIDAVRRWAEDWSLTPDDPPNGRRELGYLTYIRLLLDLGQPERSMRLLAGLSSIAVETGRRNRLIPLRVLQALALKASGRSEESAAALREAVVAAASEGYVRAFLDQGPGVAALLPMVRGAAPAFAERLSAAFKEPKTEEGVGNASLSEPLTGRECELLKLLAAGLSNEEISHQLYISINTTKTHLKSIFGKLDVANRTQAVMKAGEIGLI